MQPLLSLRGKTQRRRRKERKSPPVECAHQRAIACSREQVVGVLHIAYTELREEVSRFQAGNDILFFISLIYEGFSCVCLDFISSFFTCFEDRVFTLLFQPKNVTCLC